MRNAMAGLVLLAALVAGAQPAGAVGADRNGYPLCKPAGHHVWVVRWVRLILVTGAALLVAAVSTSRVLLGVHYPSDVAAGVALGLAWVSTAALLVSLPRNALSPALVSHRPLAQKD